MLKLYLWNVEKEKYNKINNSFDNDNNKTIKINIKKNEKNKRKTKDEPCC